jgi:hypothetical protein
MAVTSPNRVTINSHRPFTRLDRESDYRSDWSRFT